MSAKTGSGSDNPAHYSTLEAARRLGMAVRSVQLMVDRGELDAWKTPGGHRRISCGSVERWLAERRPGTRPLSPSRPGPATQAAPQAAVGGGAAPARVLLIEDSVHYHTLVRLLLQQQFPQVELHVADDGIAGLALYGEIKPDVLIVDILLPGIDGAALVSSLRSHAQFARSRLIVITSLDEAQRTPYGFALAGLPVVHKPQLAVDLPRWLGEALAGQAAAGATTAAHAASNTAAAA
ncbi:response regulator [Ideonella sp. DXS22W]|uniref:Response regulator n=1 Tax=Pseudaquabacterium inlustre TaxID=2984192 RepID=A0ABU9CGN7_9BURK